MKFLVTGAAGFIGFHLCLKLLRDGHSVYGIDNLSRKGSEKNFNLLKKIGVKIFKEDLITSNSAPSTSIFIKSGLTFKLSIFSVLMLHDK